MMNLEGIKNILPQRYPFLMIDRVLEIRAGEYCKALKNVSGNEEIFSGHFPHHAMMPAVMIIECFAQTAGCVMNSRIEEPLEFVFFAGINNAKFRKPVIPGDQLILEITLKNQRRNFWTFDGIASVEDKVVTQAEIKLMTQEI
jgi:3-hydroxyacyl-[acyl-carrier-protein] dehydratase